jgi:hypothetical protein
MRGQLTKNSEGKLFLVASLLLVVFILGKMVGLESVVFGTGVFEFRFVAALLPFAMIFRRYGIVGISVGCPLAHLLATGSLMNAFLAFGAAFGGSVSSYFLYKQREGLATIFLGTIAITVFWTVIFGTYFSFSSQVSLATGFSDTLSSLWMGVNVVGFALAAVLWRAGLSWRNQYA